MLAGAVVGLWPGALIATGPAAYQGWMPVVAGFGLGLAGRRPGKWLCGLTAGLLLALGAYVLLFGWELGLMAYAGKHSLPLIGAALTGLAARTAADRFRRR
jgi:hypothetical protein